jgi:hypothetical protein
VIVLNQDDKVSTVKILLTLSLMFLPFTLPHSLGHLCGLGASPCHAFARPEIVFKVFQFPRTMIPRIDGDPSDWAAVPDSFRIDTDQLEETVNHTPIDRKNLEVRVTFGWVKGLDRLYVLYEASDNYWQFGMPGLDGDIFELVVDGDCSGGPLIPELRTDIKLDDRSGYLFRGIHAQNYHIFTPAVDKEWCMAWGCQPWIAGLPWSNAACSYSFRPGESGRLVMECWITPFDYAPYEGPGRAAVSRLVENGYIGLSFCILDHDGPSDHEKFGFWSLSHTTTMYGNASELMQFRLMPLDSRYRKPVEAGWTYRLIDPDRRAVAFIDRSFGPNASWRWEFGDGTTSTERNPIHTYTGPGEYTVVLTVSGTAGTARLAKPYDVAVK